MKSSFLLFLFLLLNFCPNTEALSSISDLKYWFTSGNAQITKNGVIRFSSASAGNGTALCRKLIKIKPGIPYTFYADVICKTETGVRLEITFWDKDATGKLETISGPIIKGSVNKKNITNLSFSFLPPANARYVQISFQSENFLGETEIRNFEIKQSDGSLFIPRLNKKISLGSPPSAEHLKQALTLTDFLSFPNSDKQVPYQTRVSLWITEDMLYGAVFTNHQKGRLSVNKTESRDKINWNNDPLEIFITHTNQPKPLYHFGIDSGANIYDSKDGAPDWDSGFTAWKFQVSETCSGIMFRLPLSDIGYLHEHDVIGCHWRINIGRTSFINGTRHYSTMAQVDSFRNTDLFTMFKMKEGLGNRGIFSRRFANVIRTDRPKIAVFRKTKNPLFLELISKKENPFKGESVYIWHHPIFPGNVDYALQYGQEYSLRAMLDEYEKNRLHPYTSYPYGKTINQWSKSSGVGKVIYFPYHNGQNAFPYNPELRKRLLKELEDRIKNSPGEYFGVSLGDETLLYSERMLIRRCNTPGELERDPYLKTASEIIKRKYGFGKFGVPSSENTREEPFHRLATRKYLLAQMREMQKEISEICLKYKQKNGKPLVRFSSNPMSGLLLQDQSRMAPFCDIMTVQAEVAPQIHRQRLAFYTKVLRDVSGKTVWPTPHVENLFESYDSEAVAEFLSELARGGATGMQLWLADCKGNERKKGSSVSCWNGHRPRWNTIMDCARFWQNENLLKFPVESYGVFLSNDSSLSNLYMDYSEMEYLFNLLGPQCGSWFRFIPDTSIEDGVQNWKKFPVIFMTSARIQSEKVQREFLDYVRKGGVLIAFDPDLFSFGCDGKETTAFRQDLFGIDVVKCKKYSKLTFHAKNGFRAGIGTVLPLKGEHYLKLKSGTESIAVNESKETVISEKSYVGGGKAIFIAAPLSYENSYSKDWIELISGFFQQMKIPVKHDIWRFKFPAAKENHPKREDLCLTGNYFYWYLNHPIQKFNAKLPHGSYRLSALPDSAKKNSPLKYSFQKGNLTNRLSAFVMGDLATAKDRIKSGKLGLFMFADTWIRSDAFTVFWDFGANVTISELRIFYKGELPPLTISSNNKILLKTERQSSADQEVKMAVFRFSTENTRTCEIRFNERSGNASLILSEMEFWGKVSK